MIVRGERSQASNITIAWHEIRDAKEDALFVALRPSNNWAHGVVVSHPLSMREALGSIPSVSILLLGVPMLDIIRA